MTQELLVPEAGLEVATPADLNKDKFDALIELSEKIEGAVAAQVKIRTSVLKIAMPGDFVQFDEKVELGGPGSERIGALIGMSVTNIHDEKEAWEDKHGKAYTWRYIGNIRLGNRTIEKVEGRASSRDKFFGYANGAWKELSDVKESDVRTAARRSLYKEGVKLLLGLRALPANEEFLKSIGLDPTKVKKVKFDGGSASTGEKITVFTKVTAVNQKKTKTDSTVYVISLESKHTPETFSKTFAEEAKKFLGIGVRVKVVMTPTKYAPKLESIEAHIGDGLADQKEKGDGQE